MAITQPFWVTCSNLWLPIMCKKFLLLPRWNFFVCSLSSFHCTGPSSLYCPSRQLKIAIILPINLPFRKGWMHTGPAASPWMSSAPVLIASVASVGLPPVCQYHCHAREAQAAHSIQECLMGPRLLGKIPSWTCWLHPCLCSPGWGCYISAQGHCQSGVLKASSAELLPASWPQPVLLQGFVHPRGQVLCLPLKIFMDFLSTCFSILSGTLCISALSSSVSTTYPDKVSSTDLLGVQLIPSSRL